MICNSHILNFYLITFFSFFTLFFLMLKLFIKYEINLFKFLFFENLAVAFYWEVIDDANAIYFIT